MPQSLVGAARENFQASVQVLVHERVLGNHSTKQSPSGPSTAGRQLPNVPQGVVGAANEDFQTSVGIPAHGAVVGEHSGQRSPVRPCAAPGVLPNVPQRTVRTGSESFQPSVEIFPNVHDTPQADPLRVFHSQSNAWRDRLSALKNVPRVLAVFREARTLNGWIHTLRSRR